MCLVLEMTFPLHSVVHYVSVQGCGVTPIGLQHLSDVLCNAVAISNIRKLNLSDNALVSVHSIMIWIASTTTQL